MKTVVLCLVLVLTAIYFAIAPDRRFGLPIIALDICVTIVWLDEVVRQRRRLVNRR